MLSRELYKRLSLLVKLLSRAATLGIIGDFLKSKGVPSTVSNWDALLDSRLVPAIDEGRIKEGELFDLLSEAEEHGRQHVFLYRALPDQAKVMMDHQRAVKWAAKRSLKLGTTELYELPDEPKIASVRFEQNRTKEFLVVKVVEKRQYRTLIEETPDGKFVHATYELKQERAVNVARLGSDGLLEIRINRQKNSSKYQAALQAFWGLLGGLLPYDSFEEVSLAKAKERLWSKRGELTKEILYNNSAFRNENGTVVTAAAGNEEQSLFDDPAVANSMDAFMLGEGAYCDRSNVWWVARDSGTPSKNIHVLLAGEKNEFAVTAQCSKKDYEFVLGRILHHGRSIK